MNDNRDELLRQLRKEASETPLTGWTSKSGEPPPRFKSPPDDEYIDQLIVKGHPLDEMGDWIRRAAARRIAKRFGNRPAGVNRRPKLTPYRRAILTPLSGTAEVVSVVNRGDPSGFV